MFSCPIGPSQGITLPVEHLIYIYVLMYRKFMLCIFGIRVPTLRSCRVTFSKRTIVDKHLSTLNSKLTYGKVRH